MTILPRGTAGRIVVAPIANRRLVVACQGGGG